MIEGVRSFLNTPLTFGWGRLTKLSHLQGHRTAIVTDDAAMQQLGFLEQAMTHLEAAGLETSVIAQISHEPTTVDINDARPALDYFNPDWIVALGGGSVLDSTKALWVFAEYPDMDWETTFQFNDLPPINQTRLVAVPSTNGTGSETSRVSVIVDDNNGMKRLILSSEIIPTLVILDPALPMSMPPSLSAASSFDALSHAIDSSIATISNDSPSH